MAKEKHLRIESETKDLTFYYEIVGILSLIIPVLAFARLGVVGFYIMLVFKILFGDWYFLFLLTLFCYGLRCLIYHKPMNFKTLRMIGIFLILIGVMMLSHFPMHKYIVSFDTEEVGGYYSKTLGLYLDYFKNYYDGMVVGGGIIGSSFFYLFYSLFSTVGTVFMIVVFEFVGIVFFTEKTINEFFGFFVKYGLIIFNFFKKKFKSFKYEIKVPAKSKKTKRIKLEELPDATGIKYEGYEFTKAQKLKEKIENAVNRLNVFYNEIKIVVGYNVTTFIIDSIQFIDQGKLNSYLKTFMESPFLIKKELKTKKTIIEVNNVYESEYEVKLALLSETNYLNNFTYNIGMTSLLEKVELNLEQNIGLLLEDSNNYSVSFINAIILMTSIKNSKRDYKIKFLNNSSLDELTKLANDYLTLQNQEQVQNIYEFNSVKEKKERLKRHIIIINNLSEISKNQNELEKLAFILQIGIKVGFFFIVSLKNKLELPQIIENYFSKILYFKDSPNLDVSKQISGNEAFYVDKDLIERITPVGLSNELLEKFKNRI